MLKMFLSATAVSTIVISFLSAVGLAKRSPRAATSLGFGLLNGYGGNVIGGALVGSGMALSGACPGTVFAQLGVGVQSVLYTLGGAFTGAILFSLLVNLTTRVPTKFPFLHRGSSTSLDELISKKSSHMTSLVFSIVFASILFATVFLVDQWKPWKIEMMDAYLSIPTPASIIPSLRDQEWNPIFAGAVIGLLQLPSTSLTGFSIGTSSSVVSAIAYATSAVDKDITRRLPYLGRFMGNADIWQLGLVAGMTVGSFLSFSFSGANIVLSSGVSAMTSFIGGMLLILGARFANGCTSSHGISGLAHLSLSSLITVFCMFTSGILTAFLVF